jgi:hypothetical protein
MSRRAHKPDPLQRCQVEAMAGYGVPEKDIACILDVDPKTLRRHYRHELDRGAIKATATVAGFLYRKATTEGPQCVTAAIFWLKTQGQWKEAPQVHEVGTYELDRLSADQLRASLDDDPRSMGYAPLRRLEHREVERRRDHVIEGDCKPASATARQDCQWGSEYLADWYRDGTLAEYVAVEARNLAPLPGDVDFTVGASLPISGLTAWPGLFEHGRLRAGQSILVHGAAGAVGSVVTQLAREAGAHVIGTGRSADREKALAFDAQEFVDLESDVLEDVGTVDLVFDVIGGDIGKRSAGLVRPGGTLVSIVGPTETRPADGVAIDFVVEPNRVQLSEIVRRVRDGQLRTNIGNVSILDDAVAAFNPTERRTGKTIIRVRT